MKKTIICFASLLMAGNTAFGALGDWGNVATTNDAATTIIFFGLNTAADLRYVNENFTNVLKRLDSMYDGAPFPLTNSLNMYTNDLKQIKYLRGLGGTNSVVTNFTYYGNAPGLTNINAANILAGTTASAVNGTSVTNLTLSAYAGTNLDYSAGTKQLNVGIAVVTTNYEGSMNWTNSTVWVAEPTTAHEPVNYDLWQRNQNATTVFFMYTNKTAYTGFRLMDKTIPTYADTVLIATNPAVNSYPFQFIETDTNDLKTVFAAGGLVEFMARHSGNSSQTLTCRWEGYITNVVSGGAMPEYAEAGETVSLENAYPTAPIDQSYYVPSNRTMVAGERYVMRLKVLTNPSAKNLHLRIGATSLSDVHVPVAGAVVVGPQDFVGGTNIDVVASGSTVTYNLPPTITGMAKIAVTNGVVEVNGTNVMQYFNGLTVSNVMENSAETYGFIFTNVNSGAYLNMADAIFGVDTGGSYDPYFDHANNTWRGGGGCTIDVSGAVAYSSGIADDGLEIVNWVSLMTYTNDIVADSTGVTYSRAGLQYFDTWVKGTNYVIYTNGQTKVTGALLVNTTNVMTAIAGAGGGGGTNDFLLGYNRGLWANYIATNQISNDPGEIYCSGNYYKASVTTTSTIPAIPVGADLIYQYVDNSGTTENSGTINTYFSTNDCVYLDAKFGWYHPTTNADRVMNVFYTTAGTAAITNFVVESLLGYTKPAISITLGTGMNPDGTWQTPGTSESSPHLPANAVEALVRLIGVDSGSSAVVGATSKEMADLESGSQTASWTWWVANVSIQLTAWIPLGESRDIRVRGADNDDNSLAIFLLGWRIDR